MGRPEAASVVGSKTEAAIEVIFGYTVAFSAFSKGFTGSLTDLVIISSVSGTYLTAFLYYLKPVDQIVRLWLRSNSRYPKEDRVKLAHYYWSPYLRQTRSAIVSGFYLLIAAFITSKLPQFSVGPYSWLGLTIFLVGILVFLITWIEMFRLLPKIRLVRLYNEKLGERDLTSQHWEILNLIDQKMSEGDWDNAKALSDRLNVGIQAIELDEKIYIPLLSELNEWLNPSNPYTPTPVTVWKKLQKEMPHLISKIPSDLAELLNKIQSLSDRIQVVDLEVRALMTGTFHDPMIRLKGNGRLLGVIDPVMLWTSGKSLDEWSDDFVKRKSMTEWDVELLDTSGLHSGGKNEVEEFLRKVSELLEPNANANELRKRTHDAEELAKTAQKRIEQELRKPFAPLS